MEHWTDTLKHQELVTQEAKQALGKYNSNEDALVGGLNAMRLTGKPFKLPESMDKLPDDASRTDFTGKVGKLMGVVENDESMADVNFADGLPDAKMVNADLVTQFKAFAIANKLQKSVVAAMVKFNNQYALKAGQTRDQDAIDNATKVNAELLPMFGGEEGIKKHNENVKRMFQNHGGLTDEEFQAIVPGLVDSGITKSTPLSKALYNIAKQFGEGSTETPGGLGGKQEEPGIREELPKTAAILGWT